MFPTTIGLPADRSGIYGQCQDWLQARGIGVYEPQRRHGDGTIFNEWTGTGYNFRPATITMLRQLDAPMLLHCGEYYYQQRPDILRRFAPMLPTMRKALADLGITNPWFMIDEPPHFALDAAGKQRYGWTQQIEDDVISFATAAMTAGFDVGVCVPGQWQYGYWEKRIAPSWWILHAAGNYAGYRIGACWLYNAPSYDNLPAMLDAQHATGYLQWSGVRTTKDGPVPILFDATGAPTPAAHQLVAQLSAPAPALTDAEKLRRLWAAHPELHQ